MMLYYEPGITYKREVLVGETPPSGLQIKAIKVIKIKRHVSFTPCA